MAFDDPITPYGLREVQIALSDPSDDTAIPAAEDWVKLPISQTFSFSEEEDFEELRGDDKLQATRGKGPQISWDLEAGGISLAAYAVMSGATVTSSGTTPNRQRRLKKKTTDVRPWFWVWGRVISDNGGDIHAVITKCKVNGTLEGEFSDGSFEVTKAGGIGIGNADDDLYEFVHNETGMTVTDAIADALAP